MHTHQESAPAIHGREVDAPVTHQIVDLHRDFLGRALSLLIGDFKSSANWDRLHAGRNHSMLVEKLERSDTRRFFATRNTKKPHHIDYAFAGRLAASVAVGRPDDWLEHSDHMPLIVDIEGQHPDPVGIPAEAARRTQRTGVVLQFTNKGAIQ